MPNFEDSLLQAAGFVPRSVRQPIAWGGHLPFGAWLVASIKPHVLVELGTHTGNSYFSFCQSVQENKLGTRCFAVDTWQGDEHAGVYDDTVFSQVASHNEAHYDGFSRLLRMTFDEALTCFADNSIDLLHIDGLHTYEAVKHDFESWLPKLAPSAIVLFHDTNVRERGFGVWKLWEELRAKYPCNFEFLHSNGLGVLQINGPATGNLPWLKDGTELSQRLKAYFGAVGAAYVQRFDLAQAKASIDYLHDAIVWRDSQMQNLSSELNNLAKSYSAVTAAVDSKSQELADALKTIDDLRSFSQDLTMRLHDATTRLHDTTGCLHDLATQLEIAKSSLAALRGSTSWRLTIPLRFAGHILKGDFRTIYSVIKRPFLRIGHRLSESLPRIDLWSPIKKKIEGAPLDSPANSRAIDAIVAERCRVANGNQHVKILCSTRVEDLPTLDINVVTHNSSRWIAGFIKSLMDSTYPKDKLVVRFVDNASTDATLEELRMAVATLQAAGCQASIKREHNRGFGAGHNAAARQGHSPFFLVTNVDLTFDVRALEYVVATAMDDVPQVAAWELRQKPYEHPKFYDPVTGTTNWNSHACVLLRRDAFKKVGGYDEALFMYGEDVELSYRLRRKGYLLRYCPNATVFHYSYEYAGQFKPVQYLGSSFANAYIRLKYGTWGDVKAGLALVSQLIESPPAHSDSGESIRFQLGKLLRVAPKALLSRRKSSAHFPFRSWDYELGRYGAFHSLPEQLKAPPLVSIITRTYKGRSLYLQQAMLSVARQTYPAVEHIVVEDGGDTQRNIVEAFQASGHAVRYIPLAKVGRSVAGNAGLAAAKGRWCIFLDDDDLLFADHVEVLVNALYTDEAAAAYSLAWKVETDDAPLATGRYRELSHEISHDPSQRFDPAVLWQHNYLPIQCVMFERTLYLERGGFEEDMDALEDWTLWLKYSVGNHFVRVEKVTSLFRIPADPVRARSRADALTAAYSLALKRAAGYIRDWADVTDEHASQTVA